MSSTEKGNQCYSKYCQLSKTLTSITLGKQKFLRRMGAQEVTSQIR